jgi:hypothetical protein
MKVYVPISVPKGDACGNCPYQTWQGNVRTMCCIIFHPRKDRFLVVDSVRGKVYKDKKCLALKKII